MTTGTRRPPPHVRHVRITAKRSWLSFGLREMWTYRELARILAGRDITLRYRQTMFGVAGVVIAPLVTAGIMSFVFGEVADLPSEGVPYVAFSYAGFLGWNLFTSVVLRCAGVLTGNASLVTKIYVPRLLLPLSSIFVAYVDLAITSILMVVMLAIYGLSPGPELLLLPVWIVGLSSFAIGLGFALAAGQAHYRDVGTLTNFLLQALLFLTPVAYSVSAVPERFKALFVLNPVATFIEGLRWSVLDTTAPSLDRVAISLAMSALCVLAGSMVFVRLEQSVADVI